MKSLDLSKRKLDIIVTAGQSNAQGNGRGNDELHYKGNPRAFQLTTIHLVSTYGIKGLDGTYSNVWCPPLPNDYIINELNEDYHDEIFNHGFYLSFVDDYVENYLKDGRDVIVVKTPAGGSTFSDGMWVRGGCLYKRMFEMINMILKLNKENKIVAFLWHQGESDTDHGRDDVFYKKHIIRLFKDVRKKYKKFDFPILTGEFVEKWKKSVDKDAGEKIKKIENVFYDLKTIFPNYDVVSSKGLKSNGEVNKNDDIIHFSRIGQIEFGHRYFKAFDKIRKENC